jgi:hypothetical protein
MSKAKLKPRILSNQVWCVDCADKIPPNIRRADFLIPLRLFPYGLSEDECSIDLRVIGICKECLKYKEDFQKNNTELVDINHKHLVYRKIL